LLPPTPLSRTCDVYFFCDATAKFVSSVVYVKVKKHGARVRDIVEAIRRRLTKAVAPREYYMRYDDYLITPFQKAKMWENWRLKKSQDWPKIVIYCTA